jgi:sulfoxide reductase catalytic subunit YedY
MQRLYSIFVIVTAVMVSAFLAVSASIVSADEKIILAPDTPDSKILRMNPKNIDPSLLPLDTIEDLHTTGRPMDVDIREWRLEISGPAVDEPVYLKYNDLLRMDMIKKKVLLICPGFFADYAEWEGVPFSTILDKAGVGDNYERITFYALDGFKRSLNKKEIENNLLFLSLKVNGLTLPKEHGFPVRLVAEHIYGGRWVKWIDRIEIK